MPNSYVTPPSPSSNSTDVEVSPAGGRRRRPDGRKITAIGAVVALGALFGTGYGVQSAADAQENRIALASSLTKASGFEAAPLYPYDDVVEAHAEQNAEVAISGANVVMASAQGKTDTTALSASVASLSYFTLLAPERVFELVDVTTAEATKVQAAAAEVDRIAAEQAAAAAAAAAQAAAEKAAAERAAAETSAPARPSTSSRPAAPSDPSGAQAIARDMMASQYGWGSDQFGCLVPLWDRESGWNVNAYNASSGATGIPQALPGNKMASAGADWQTNPATQIAWGLGYIADRYGTPCAAWDHSESVGWY
ncbi:MAG: hypothetical protein JWQ59_1237 [Cryobacterium sp.]|jgi:hypothetical protein|nr:hypothetical protein [Cryobacterium sp.]